MIFPINQQLFDADVKKILPHKDPFLFVDNIVEYKSESVTTKKKLTEIEFDYYVVNKSNIRRYPPLLLIEHGAQSMLLHGYFLGIELGFWGEDYHILSILTKLKDMQFFDVLIEPNETIYTVTKFVKRFSHKHLLGRVEIYNESQTLLCKGLLQGIRAENDISNLFSSSRVKENNSSNTNMHFDFLNAIDSKSFDSTFWFLKGHFPQLPCIPGCIALSGLSQSIGRNIKKINEAKFKKIMTPNNVYIYDYTQLTADTYTFRFVSGNEEYISGNISVE